MEKKEIIITQESEGLRVVTHGFNKSELLGIYSFLRSSHMRTLLDGEAKDGGLIAPDSSGLTTKEFISLAIKRRLNIGVRSLNILKTMEDDYPFINNITKYDILVQRNAGKKTAMEIEDALCVIGIEMKRGNRADANTKKLEIIRRKYPTS